MGTGLTGVEENQSADGASRRRHGSNGRDGAGHVGHVGKRNQSSVRRDDGESLQVDPAVGRQIQPRELGTRALTQLLPRNDVRVMLGAGAHDAIARPHAQSGRLRASHPLRCVSHGESHQVDRLGRVLRPHDLVGGDAHERGQGAPSALKSVGRLVAEKVRTSVDRAVATAVEVGLGVDDARRLLRGRRCVEVRNGRAAAPDATQNRKVRSNRVELGGGEVRRHGDQRPRYLS